MKLRALGSMMAASTASLLITTSMTFAGDALKNCAASRSEEILRIVKGTAGLTQKTQLDGLHGLVRHFCVDQLQLAKEMKEEEVESAIERETAASVRLVFGDGYLVSHPLK